MLLCARGLLAVRDIKALLASIYQHKLLEELSLTASYAMEINKSSANMFTCYPSLFLYLFHCLKF